ncbi:B12-binding domain-containing radical SAM protein [Amycolatopsis kentuckyensis]|uniref:B12-binding domain-containing radical SAM protein n=1 Tax=Amycolatopsis kentuckyensis TaxID=218823 RepID=UPI001AC001EE|nr:radical SAM protein [Amycolatopsis kentuckyensis]
MIDPLIVGADTTRPLDCLFVNAPLRDYAERPRANDFTLPVLGMAYIATFAAAQGFNVGVLDAEAYGLGISAAAKIVNDAEPRWAGLNLLAPTYELSAGIAEQLDPRISLVLGGHHARALPSDILHDQRMAHCEALIIGEAETRVTELLHDLDNRTKLPGVMWRDAATGRIRVNNPEKGHRHLAPDINAMPFVNRTYLPQDPFWTPEGRLEAAMVGARGCPYDCSFCGAAVSANPDVTIRTRHPDNIIGEMFTLREELGVTVFRFVDDLFLGAHRVIKTMMSAFRAENIGKDLSWDATGRINVLHRESDETLELLAANGLREVALGIESGSDRMLSRIDKRITREMTKDTVRRLLRQGINVKGYFILGMPSETREETDATVRLVKELWTMADEIEGGTFRASVFEYRPYPGTLDWQRLVAEGKYRREELLAYTAVDLTSDGSDESMRARDEFNFSVNLQFCESPVSYLRERLVELTRLQFERKPARLVRAHTELPQNRTPVSQRGS